LYVPGDRPDLLQGAANRGADALVVDLEDAVAATRKDEARANLARWVQAVPGPPDGEVWVRVNNDPDLLAADLEAVRATPWITGISLPKVESADHVEAAASRLGDGQQVICLIETAAGLLAAPAIAAAPRVAALALGEADLAAGLGMMVPASASDLLPIRLQIVTASAAAGIGRPIGPVSTDYRDLAALRATTADLRRIGFGARSAIHPDQVAVINEVFTPSGPELDEAARIVRAADEAAATGSGVFVDVDGRMVDEAVVRSARRLLAHGDALGRRP
jgi:citrate lyase subunit beta/citryl-CoA lyase